jgi:hypothetical protein
MLGKGFYILIICCGIPHILFSQRIEHVDFYVEDSKIIVVFGLQDCPPNKSYDFGLFYKHEGRVREATSVEGDLRNQQCGGYKQITWNVLSDRSSLNGKIQFEVRVVGINKIKRPSRTKDRGYIGLSTGVFVPYKSFSDGQNSVSSDNLEKPGANVELSISWLGKRKSIFGYTTSIRGGATGFLNEMTYSEETQWANVSFAFGPLISIPFSSKVVWDLRPMLGYSETFVTSSLQNSLFYTPDFTPINAGNFCIQLGTVFRFNVLNRMNLILAGDYFETNPSFSEMKRNINCFSVSFGMGIRF